MGGIALPGLPAVDTELQSGNTPTLHISYAKFYSQPHGSSWIGVAISLPSTVTIPNMLVSVRRLLSELGFRCYNLKLFAIHDVKHNRRVCYSDPTDDNVYGKRQASNF